MTSEEQINCCWPGLPRHALQTAWTPLRIWTCSWTCPRYVRWLLDFPAHLHLCLDFLTLLSPAGHPRASQPAPGLPRATNACCWTSPRYVRRLLDFPSHLRPTWTSLHYVRSAGHPRASTPWQPDDMNINCWIIWNICITPDDYRIGQIEWQTKFSKKIAKLKVKVVQVTSD